MVRQGLRNIIAAAELWQQEETPARVPILQHKEYIDRTLLTQFDARHSDASILLGRVTLSSNTGSGFIKRNRPPRVQIQYQDPYNSEKMVELPFVTGVMSDLSGNNPGVEKSDMGERKFTDVTKDTLDEYMASIQPGMTFVVSNRLDVESGEKLGVNLRFEKMEDLEPAAIARQVPALKKLLETREHLANLQRYIAAKPRAQEHVKKLLGDPELMAALAARAEAEIDDNDGAA